MRRHCTPWANNAVTFIVSHPVRYCGEVPDDAACKLLVELEAAGQRLDQFLAARLTDLSRARIQQMIAAGKVLVAGVAAKPALRLRGGEEITIGSAPEVPRLRALPEDIPLDIVYEDHDLAVVNKPAGMMVHAGAGSTEDARNRGTLVNALLHHFRSLSGVGGELRPGIVHRLDRATSGLIIVAKNDIAHRKLSEQFSKRRVRKHYLALVHGWPKQEKGTISAAISRDRIRRTRMTTRRSGGRDAVTHYVVREKIDSPYGKFAYLEVKIDTGRTHQIRVHLASIGHPVVGDTLYGAPRMLAVSPDRSGNPKSKGEEATLNLPRNFLHAFSVEFVQPSGGQLLQFSRPLPPDLAGFLERLRELPA
jgi:23S rRNA pseudouridine1911/1915/1917 synthase